MRIVNRATLMGLPAGTLFSYFTPCAFTDLRIKTSAPNTQRDFLVSDIIGALEYSCTDDFINACHAMMRDASHPVDFSNISREGLFDDHQLFAIYEPVDVRALITRLEESLTLFAKPMHQNGA